MPQLIAHLSYNALHFPDHKAIEIDGRSWTWKCLDAASLQLAGSLSQRIVPRMAVAVAMANSLEWAAVYYALMRLGAVIVPVNTRLRPDEIVDIMNDCGAGALIADESIRGRGFFEGLYAVRDRLTSCGVLWCNRAGREMVPHPVTPGEPARVHAARVNIIQYTSGTTSFPKGVMLNQLKYIATARYVAACQGLHPARSIISAAPFFHCSGTMHALTVSLVSAAPLYSMPTWEPEQFLDLVEAHGIAVSHMIFFRDLAAMNPETVRRKLETLRIGHELGSEEYLRFVSETYDIPELSNIYGMTETCGQFAMWHHSDPKEARLARNGRPQAGNLIEIRGQDGTVLPAGKSGEIHLMGITLAEGYLDTQRNSVHMFGDDGWFWTGDFGSLNERGELLYIARSKDIIRVGGENFAPVEMEEWVRTQFPRLQFAIIGVRDQRLDEVPALAVVEGTAMRELRSVLQAVRRRFAGFKQPRHTYMVNEIPLTSTGKIKRNELTARIVAGHARKVDPDGAGDTPRIDGADGST